MKERISKLLICCLLSSIFVGCSSSSSNANDTSDNKVDVSSVDVESTTQWYKDNSNSIGSGLYVVGKDIKEGSYGLTCTSDYLTAYIFEDMNSYLNYFRSSRFTVGEESEAAEKNALSAEYPFNGKTIACNLHDGNVLLIKNGYGIFEQDNSVEPTKVSETKKIYEGLYNIGSDISQGTYMLTALDDCYLEVILFENKDQYDLFMENKGVSNGEFYNAVEQYAIYCDGGYSDISTCINVEKGNVLLIESGSGILEGVSFAWQK